MQEDHQIERRKIDRAVKWERRFQSLAISLVGVGITWGVSTLASLDKSMAAVVPHLEQIDMQVAAMYRAKDAQRDIAELRRDITTGDARDAEHDRKIDELGTRVTALERTHTAIRAVRKKDEAK